MTFPATITSLSPARKEQVSTLHCAGKYGGLRQWLQGWSGAPSAHERGFCHCKGSSKRWKELAIEVGQGSRRKFPETLKTNKTSHQGWGFTSPGRAIPWLQHHSHIPAPCPPTDASGCCDAWLSLPLWEAEMEP